MKKVVYALCLLLVSVSCSNDDNAGHASLSFKIDGVLHDYKNITIVKNEADMFDPLSSPFYNISGSSVTNNSVHNETFRLGRREPYLDFNTFSLELTQASGQVLYSQIGRLVCDFSVSDANSVVGSFHGYLSVGNTGESVEITDGSIDIEYGSSNYTVFNPHID
ncbi:hypothetical protein [Flavobacterium sp. GT3R68]|uniref:hypothetical protein n=1 Tax=Flavobacterium sp. GT3R68 TaxID=2594437 RepID=UPI001185617F|nr:hypothetical protein [Flavobacterium sp. GT3R68]TRW91152.1 hypothetical protein FNW07_10040 [Flavobacterium sp. GT3R68]